MLIAGFGALDRGIARERLPRWLMPVYTLVLSSVLAGLATAPFAAAHFNRFTDYGLVANLLTVPVMSVLMAAGAMAALLAPLGLAAPAIWVMDMAARWILFVAHQVSGLDQSVTAVPTPGPWVLPLITLGGAWAMLWRGPVRRLAVVPLMVAGGLWWGVERPALLIAEDGSIAGVLGAEGRALSKARGGGFSAQSWLENDGDLADQPTAAARPGFEGPVTARTFTVAAVRGQILSGKGARAALPAACATADLVILPATAPAAGGRCRVLDAAVLRQTGTLAGWIEDGRLVLRPARSASRRWTGDGPVWDAIVLAPAGPPAQ